MHFISIISYLILKGILYVGIPRELLKELDKIKILKEGTYAIKQQYLTEREAAENPDIISDDMSKMVDKLQANTSKLIKKTKTLRSRLAFGIVVGILGIGIFVSCLGYYLSKTQ